MNKYIKILLNLSLPILLVIGLYFYLIQQSNRYLQTQLYAYGFKGEVKTQAIGLQGKTGELLFRVSANYKEVDGQETIQVPLNFELEPYDLLLSAPAQEKGLAPYAGFPAAIFDPLFAHAFKRNAALAHANAELDQFFKETPQFEGYHLDKEAFYEKEWRSIEFSWARFQHPYFPSNAPLAGLTSLDLGQDSVFYIKGPHDKTVLSQAEFKENLESHKDRLPAGTYILNGEIEVTLTSKQQID